MFKIVVQINKPANAVFTYLSDIESSPALVFGRKICNQAFSRAG
jgi:hypothetical protein